MGTIKQFISWMDSGLDYDSDLKYVAQGDSDNRVNVTTNEEGRDFVITNMKGTTEKSHALSHDSTYNGAVYSVIGSCYDDNRDAVYIFIYSDLENDSILRFNFADDSFDKICWDHTGLGFDPDYPISDPYMIGDFLHFNPRTTSPRAINVQWAYWDFVAYAFKMFEAVEWSIGDYVKEDNKVYEIIATGVDKGDTILIDHPEKATFVEWTYHDVDTVPDSASFGEYDRYRNFYNTPTPIANRPYTDLRSDTDVAGNYVRGNIFQFSYRFHIPGQGFTISSPFSEMIVNENDESLTGETLEDITSNNFIRVGFPVDDYYYNSGVWLFEFVQILFRKNADEEWRIADTIYHDEAVTWATNTLSGAGAVQFVCGTDFYNDKAYPVADTASVEKPYNALPVLARSQWSLDGARSAYGGITEGFDVNPGGVNITLAHHMRTVTLKGTLGGTPTTYTFTEVQTRDDADPDWWYYTNYNYNTAAISALPVGDGKTSPWTIVFSKDSETYYGTYAGASVSDYRDAVLDTVNLGSVGAYINGSDQIEFMDDHPHEVEINIYDSNPVDAETITKIRSFKTNAHHPFCIFYYDEMMRRSEPQIQYEATSVFIPSLPERDYNTLDALDSSDSGGGTVRIPCTGHGYTTGDKVVIDGTANYDGIYEIVNVNDADTFDITSAHVLETFAITDTVAYTGTHWQQYIRWAVGNDAPSWAKYWRWGYAGNRSVSQFWQYNIETMAVGTGNWTDFLAVYISGLQTITDESAGNDNIHPDSNISSYVFEEGDRIRFITQDYGTAYDELVLAASDYDYEIKSFDESSHTIYLDLLAVGGTPWADYDGNNCIVEIYRPLKDPEDLIFYEIGQIYEVYLDSGRYYHRGETRDQTSSVTATGEFSTGDVYLVSRQLANGPFANTAHPVFVESYHWSDFYESDTWGKGKVGIVTGIGQKYLNNIRYSNKYSPNTMSSGVSEFDALDYKTMSDDHGKITAMRQAGHTLKVYFERNSASVLVNKTQFYDADGISQVVKSDDVLGTADYSNYGYGTIFPESVILIDRTVYFYDIYRKAYVRDASNGITDLSARKYKMHKYFQGKSDALLTSGVANIQVWSGWDSDSGLLYVAFMDSSTVANKEVITWRPESNRWITFVELDDGSANTPPSIGTTARSLISFLDEDIWIHNTNSTRGLFYGDQKTAVLNIIINENAALTKILDSITLNTNEGSWAITSIEIPVTAQYPRGMYSEIQNEVFTGRENGMHAEFLRNMKTSTAVALLLELTEGEQLRGQVATITLENAVTSEVVLFDVSVNMSHSNL